MVFAIERNGVGQEAFEHLGRDFGRMEFFQPVLLGGVEENAEALDLVEGLGARLRSAP